MGGGFGGFGGFGSYGYGYGYGYGQAYGGFGGQMAPYSVPVHILGSFVDPYGYLNPDALDNALQLGHISPPQYTQIILLYGDGGRRRLRRPWGRRVPYWRGLGMGPGLGYASLGRRGLMSGLIPGRGLGWGCDD